MNSEAQDTHEDVVLSDPTCYQKLVGKLLYLTMTRPDISYVVQNLSQFMHKTKKSHMEGALRVIRYLKMHQVWELC